MINNKHIKQLFIHLLYIYSLVLTSDKTFWIIYYGLVHHFVLVAFLLWFVDMDNKESIQEMDF